MAIDTDQPPSRPPQADADIATTTEGKDTADGGGSTSIIHSFSALFPLVLGVAFLIGLVLAFLILWLNRRRARAHAARTGTGAGANEGKGIGTARDGDEGGVLTSPDSSARPSAEEGEGEDGMGGSVREGGGGGGGGGGGRLSMLMMVGRRGKGKGTGTVRRKLQKACSVGAGPGWWVRDAGRNGSTVGLLSDEEDGEGRGWPRRHVVSMPLIPRACTKGHFHFGLGSRSESCHWPGQEDGKHGGGGGVEMEEVRVCRTKPSWIDEDALHGPKVREVPLEDGSRGRQKNKKRGSWPLRNRAPTLPRVHYTIHGYPYMMSGARNGSSGALLGESQLQPATTTSMGMDYTQLRDFSRVLPAPPKPALVANRDRSAMRKSVTMGYVYGASNIPKPVITPPDSPVRSTPTTPLKYRGRQQSTGSTLTDILRSTEQRLREGSVSGTARSRRATTSPTRVSPGKVFGPREYGIPVSRSRTPSPAKAVSNQAFVPGHKRQESQKFVSSEADSLVGEEFANPGASAGLTSPSRVLKKPDAGRQLPQTQSARTSLSSELSTLYSEDEMPEEVKRAIMPLEGLIVQPQQAADVRPPSVNDPFVSAPAPLSVSRASSTGGWSTKHSRPQDLLRQSVQRSQRLRSMTVGHIRAQSQGLILAPGPVIQGPKPGSGLVIPPSRKASVTTPKSVQPYIASRNSEPPPSPTRNSPTNQSPTGPLFLRVTKTSTLSTIPLLPPPSAPGLVTVKELKPKELPPIKTAQTTSGQQQPTRRSPVLMLPSTERSPTPPSPTRRVGGEMLVSLILPPKPFQDSQHRNSASSSVYSQDTNPTTVTQTAIELNRAGFAANSSLYPAPLSPRGHTHARAPSPSKLSTEVHTSSPHSNNEISSEDEDDTSDTDDDTPLALISTIASLRRMNSGVSTAPSLQSVRDRNATPTPSPSPSPDRVVPGMAVRSMSMGPAGSSPVMIGGDSPVQRRSSKRKSSIGVRNYFILGNGSGAVGGAGGASRRVSRVVSCGVVGTGGIVKSPSGGSGVDGSGSDTGPPYKRRRPGSMCHRRASSALRLSRSDFGVGGEEGKENSNDGGDGKFKVAAAEFTFEVSNPNVSAASGKGGLGLREGSSGSVNALVMPQQNDGQRLSLAWKPADGSVSRNGSPVRSSATPSRTSMRSVDSLGLYDRQGFLISASPVRGVSPSGLRV